jgi:hypothetical protein
LIADLWQTEGNRTPNGVSDRRIGDSPLKAWKLIPQGSAKPVPDYIPKALRDDYEEACSIADLSPKSAATLCRRCLQGMIRDFWEVNTKSDRLWEEMKAIKEKLDPETWDAIVAVKDIGNIGAHMEKADINAIVDVEPREAQLLIELIESLFADWYVARETKRRRHVDLMAAAASKKTTGDTPADV